MNKVSIRSSRKNKYFGDHEQITSPTNIQHKRSYRFIIMTVFINSCKEINGILIGEKNAMYWDVILRRRPHIGTFPFTVVAFSDSLSFLLDGKELE